MWRPSPLPSSGEVFLDARGDGRGLRVSWHPEADVVVLSLWRGSSCTGTFRLAVDEVPELIEVLRGGLRTAYDRHRGLLESVFADDTGDIDAAHDRGHDGSLAG
jgi:hypothetical protein